MKIQILVDNKNSWILPYARKLLSKLRNDKHDVSFLFNHNDVVKGDILFLLSCERLFKKLSLNKHNIVVHESNLPKGKGWSPVTWEILKGKNEIVSTLFEAEDELDSGVIYVQKKIKFLGDELVNEIRSKQGKSTIDICYYFVKNYKNISGKKQLGKSSFYRKRNSDDSELNINQTILEQFNLLRVCDNKRYPAHFYHMGQKYVIKIYKDEK